MQVIDQLHRNLGVMSICTFKFYSVWAMCFPSMIMIESALSLIHPLDWSLLIEYQADEFYHIGHVQETVVVHICHSHDRDIILLLQNVSDQCSDVAHIDETVAVHISHLGVLLLENIFHSSQGIDFAVGTEMRVLASVCEVVLYRRES